MRSILKINTDCLCFTCLSASYRVLNTGLFSFPLSQQASLWRGLCGLQVKVAGTTRVEIEFRFIWRRIILGQWGTQLACLRTHLKAKDLKAYLTFTIQFYIKEGVASSHRKSITSVPNANISLCKSFWCNIEFPLNSKFHFYIKSIFRWTDNWFYWIPLTSYEHSQFYKREHVLYLWQRKPILLATVTARCKTRIDFDRSVTGIASKFISHSGDVQHPSPRGILNCIGQWRLVLRCVDHPSGRPIK